MIERSIKKYTKAIGMTSFDICVAQYLSGDRMTNPVVCLSTIKSLDYKSNILLAFDIY